MTDRQVFGIALIGVSVLWYLYHRQDSAGLTPLGGGGEPGGEFVLKGRVTEEVWIP